MLIQGVGGVMMVCVVVFFQAGDGIRDLVRSRGLGDGYKRQEAPLACHVVRELLAGIAHIHELRGPDGHGLIHRHVSPSNVFLSLGGDVKPVSYTHPTLPTSELV